MLSIKDIEKLNIFSFLRPYEIKIKEIFIRHGTAATGRYINKFYHIKLTGAEIREFLGVNKNNHSVVNEVHKLAWATCGWNGSYNPIAAHRYMETSGDDKGKTEKQIVEQNETGIQESQIMSNQSTVNLLAAGLLSSGSKLNLK